MIIECSRCQTRAKLPDSKEGSKVRCPECGHVCAREDLATSPPMDPFRRLVGDTVYLGAIIGTSLVLIVLIVRSIIGVLWG